jgi:hypothetical protein
MSGAAGPKTDAWSQPTFVKSIHVQLSDEGGDIGVLEVRAARVSESLIGRGSRADSTHAKTLENSDVGDMTKLSLVPDHEMRCWMLGSSSILETNG